MSLKKYIPLIIVLSGLFTCIVLFFVYAPQLSEEIDNAKTLYSIEQKMTFLNSRGIAFHEKFGRWPSLQELDSLNTPSDSWNQQYWSFTVEEHQDTFVVTATLGKEYANLEIEHIGEYLCIDNFGNKTYSHEDFKRRYFKRFLRDAKKVDNKKN